MAPSRHKHVRAREPRLARLHLERIRPTVRVGIAVAATVGAVSSGVAMSAPDGQAVSALSAPAAPATETPEAVSVRVEPISRSADRVQLKRKPAPAPKATGHRYVTAPLNAWSGPGERFELLAVLPVGRKVAVSGVVKGPWAEIVVGKKSRWVRAEYLSESKPEPEVEETVAGVVAEGTGLSSAPCASGSSVESGLTSNAIAVHRAVCAAFPSVTSYGGVRDDGGEHGTGHALDIMVTGSTGDAIADWVRDNAGALGVSEVLWSQQIWTVERASDGWRFMEDRGSTTANHYDHVHVTVF